MFTKLALAVSMAMLSSTSVAAEPLKFYVGADVGKTRFNSPDMTSYVGGQGMFAGYKINDTFHLEVGLRRLHTTRGATTVTYEDVSYSSSYESKLNQTSVSVIGAIPLATDLKLFGRFGVNRVSVSGSGTYAGEYETWKEHETKLMGGFGLSYSFTPKLSVRLELQRPFHELLNLSAGVAYNF